MSRADLKTLVNSELRDTVGYLDSEITQEREKAIEYYMGKPIGGERKGKSQVVSRDVYDVIEGLLPGLMKTFHGVDEAVEFQPVGPEDEQHARQATDYCNYVYNADNPGFDVTYQQLKDGLLQILGIVKVGWVAEDEEIEESYDGLSEGELANLAADDSVEVTGQYSEPVPHINAGLYSVDIKRVESNGRVEVVNVPPEEFFISRRARNVDSAPCVAHGTAKPRHEWISMGFDEAAIMAIPPHDDVAGTNESDERHENDVNRDQRKSTDPMNEEVFVIEAYVWLEGKRHRVFVGGRENGEILEDPEPVEDHCFSTFCPVPFPHRAFGTSVAQSVMDLQEIKTVAQRQMIDGNNLANSAGWVVREGKVNLEDVLHRGDKPSRVIRVKGSLADSFAKLDHSWDGSQNLGLLDYMDSVREQRTGLSRRKLGSEPAQLHRQDGAAGAMIDQQNSEARTELIARIYAETFKRTMRLILRLLVKHQDKPRTIRLRNEWVDMDPSTWNDKMDLEIKVGFGTGDKARRVAALENIIQKQIAALQQMPRLCQPEQLYNALTDQVRAMEFASPERYYRDPMTPEEPAWKPPQAPDSDMAKVEVAAKKAEAEVAMKQEQAAGMAQIEQQKLLSEIQIERERMNQEFDLRVREMQIEAELKAAQIASNADSVSTNIPRN